MQNDFLEQHARRRPAEPPHRLPARRGDDALRRGKAFDLDEEPAELRDAYGRNLFGQGCLLARRLVEQGVPFVEVSLDGVNLALGWDTHINNFDAVRRLSGVLDPAWATLMEDLKDRGLLDSTLIVWMGEFGRTPKINGPTGRDHWANSWSTVLAGGGIKGGQVIGKTSADGMAVEERPVRRGGLPGHRRPGPGHRHHEAEPLQRRPAHPHRRAERQADQGGARMKCCTLPLRPAWRAGTPGLRPSGPRGRPADGR